MPRIKFAVTEAVDIVTPDALVEAGVTGCDAELGTAAAEAVDI